MYRIYEDTFTKKPSLTKKPSSTKQRRSLVTEKYRNVNREKHYRVSRMAGWKRQAVKEGKGEAEAVAIARVKEATREQRLVMEAREKGEADDETEGESEWELERESEEESEEESEGEKGAEDQGHKPNTAIARKPNSIIARKANSTIA